MSNNTFDAILVTTASDYKRVSFNWERLLQLMPVDKIVFVGSAEVGELIKADNWPDRVRFVNENDVIPFEDVNNILKDILNTDDVPRGITGWYYQQFLKMKYCDFSEHDYYLIWDGDTVPTKEFSMFSNTGAPYFDLKHEYFEEYFITMNKLLGLNKVIKKSFISEHMLFNKDIMRRLIADIEKNSEIKGEMFFEKILRAVRVEKIRSNSFSEYETYGTYVAINCTNLYALRDWHSVRFGSMFFIPTEMKEDDYIWLSKDFDAVSFEKDEEYLPDYAALFQNPEYREKLSARQVMEAIQDIALTGLHEKWED